MYINKTTGCKIYETLDELLASKIISVTEDDQFYYFIVENDQFFDESMWKVSKKTGEVMWLHYVDYMLDIEDKATPVDLTKLKRAS